MNIEDTVNYLFDRDFNEEITDEQEDELDKCFNEAISKYGWDKTFEAIDSYMRLKCLDGNEATNFALWFSFYRCSEAGKINEPYRFLGYLYYRMELEPWKYDALDIMDGLVKDILSNENDKRCDPFWNEEYKPENDPEIIAEVEKLRNEGK